MQGYPEVCVLRLGHRPGRDNRMTTHVGLAARALGADRVVIAGDASKPRGTIEDITARFGGPFEVELRDEWRSLIRDWPGVVVHLTMYGEPVQGVEETVRERHRGDGEPVLVVVGAGKVPFEVYEAAEFNVGVTNQPHSEVAGLAVFLDRLFEGAELDREWVDADRRVVPRATGKEVVPVGPDGNETRDDGSETRDDGGDARDEGDVGADVREDQHEEGRDTTGEDRAGPSGMDGPS